MSQAPSHMATAVDGPDASLSMLSGHAQRALLAVPNLKRDDWGFKSSSSPFEASRPGFARTRRAFHLASGVIQDTEAVIRVVREYDAKCRRRKYGPWEWGVLDDKESDDGGGGDGGGGGGVGGGSDDSERPITQSDYIAMLRAHKRQKRFRRLAKRSASIRNTYCDYDSNLFRTTIDGAIDVMEAERATFAVAQDARRQAKSTLARTTGSKVSTMSADQRRSAAEAMVQELRLQQKKRRDAEEEQQALSAAAAAAAANVASVNLDGAAAAETTHTAPDGAGTATASPAMATQGQEVRRRGKPPGKKESRDKSRARVSHEVVRLQSLVESTLLDMNKRNKSATKKAAAANKALNAGKRGRPRSMATIAAQREAAEAAAAAQAAAALVKSQSALWKLAPMPHTATVALPSRPRPPVDQIARLGRLARRVHTGLAKKDVPRAQRMFDSGRSAIIANAKKLAVDIQKEWLLDRTARRARIAKETLHRCKRLQKEMNSFWRKNDKLEKERQKQAQRQKQRELKELNERREAKRQDRKFNYLVTQTELYAHFMSRKDGKKAEGEGGAAAAAAGSTAASAGPGDEDAILSRLDKGGPGEEDLGLDGGIGEEGLESAEAMKARAIANAAAAHEAHRAKTAAFDAKRKKAASAARVSPGVDGQTAFDSSFSLANPDLASTDEVAQPKMLNCTLKPYQLNGLRWLANLYAQGINGILADEMGLGKTVQSIATIAHLAETEGIWGPFLVVSPVSTLPNWLAELQRFTPEFRVIPYWGKQDQRKVMRKFWTDKALYTREASFHVCVTNYETVTNDAKYFNKLNWQYMILDEAQALKNNQSKRSQVLLKFNCRNRLLLTGTPIQNSMAELWALLHFIMPALFDNHAEFNEWFSKDIESHAQDTSSALDVSQLSRLHMILKPFMLRRIKHDVENELGEKIEVQINCYMTPRQRALYNGIKRKISIDELLANTQGKGLGGDSLMNLVMQFRKVCAHPELFERRPATSPFLLSAWHPPATLRRSGDSHTFDGGEDLELITPLNENPVTLALPRVVFRAFVRRDTEHAQVQHRVALCEGNVRLATTTLGPTGGLGLGLAFASEIHASSITNGGTFGFTRLCALSPAETAAVMRGAPIERLLLHMLIESHAQMAQPSLFSATQSTTGPLVSASPSRRRATSRMLLIRPPGASSPLPAHFHQAWTNIVPSTSIHIVLNLVHPAVECAPPLLCASDQAATRYNEQMLRGSPVDVGIRAMLSGPSSAQTSAGNTAATITTTSMCQALALVPNGGLLGALPTLRAWNHVVLPSRRDMIDDCAKLRVLDGLLRRLKREGHRVLVYSQMTRMLDLLEEFMVYRRHVYVRIDGSDSVEVRRERVEDFQGDADIFAFLLSTKAGGLGINLTAADTVIFYDSDWNPTNDQQAMDRSHRLGQTRQVTVYRLVTKGTVEERILQRAQEKNRVQEMVIKGGNYTADAAVGGADARVSREEVVGFLLDDEVERELKAKREQQKAAERAKKEAEKERKARERAQKAEELRRKREERRAENNKRRAEEKAKKQELAKRRKMMLSEKARKEREKRLVKKAAADEKRRLQKAAAAEEKRRKKAAAAAEKAASAAAKAQAKANQSKDKSKSITDADPAKKASNIGSVAAAGTVASAAAEGVSGAPAPTSDSGSGSGSGPGPGPGPGPMVVEADVSPMDAVATTAFQQDFNQ